MPSELRYLWRAFMRMHVRRSSNGYGPNPITWPEIEAFVRLSGLDLRPWEIEIIEELDNIYRAVRGGQSFEDDDEA